MSGFDYDLFVIGAGSGGVRAARMSASMGARVAVAEERYLGGTCVNVGCIPKKLLVYASHFRAEFEDAVGYGWRVPEPGFEWPVLVANKNREIERLNGTYARLLTNAGVGILHGRAVLRDAHTVEVDGRHYSAERILVATGGWPHVPSIPGREFIVTSNETFYLPRLPQRIVIVGGGYIAVEFAGIFCGLGCEVTQLYRGPLFLRGFDDDIRTFLAGEMTKQGVDLRFNVSVQAVEKNGEEFSVALENGQTLSCDMVMYATGRRPMTDGLGLEAAGVTVNSNGAIPVDENYRTNIASIHAIGDVTDRVNLTPVAIAEGMALAWHLFADHERPVDYEFIPSAVFSQPNLGTVGYTETEARKKFGELTIFKSSFTPLKHTLSGRAEEAFMKLVVETATDRVVGVHMVGHDAGETIQGLAVALKAGATKGVFDRTIGIHPTAAEEFVTMREPAR